MIDCPDPYKPSQRHRRIGLIAARSMFGVAFAVSLSAAFWPARLSPFAPYLPWLLIIVLFVLVFWRAYLARKSKAVNITHQAPFTDEAIVSLCTPGFWDR